MKYTQLLSLLLAAACASLGSESPPLAQQMLDQFAQRYQEVVRLTLHGVPSGESGLRVIASTDPVRVGKASDPEDLNALASGEAVVLDEQDALDVTVPVLPLDGRSTAVVGVTLRFPAGADRDATIARAKAIAAAVARGVQASPEPLY
jgi:hypothetical protein